MCPVLGCTRAGSPLARMADGSYWRARRSAQEASGRGYASDGVVGFDRHAHGANLRDAHRKQPALGIESRFFADRQGGSGAIGTDAEPDHRIAERPGTGAAMEGIRTMRDASKDRWQSPATTSKPQEGRRRAKKQQDRQRILPCLREKHSPQASPWIGTHD